MEIGREVIDELRCGALRAIDGLWFLAVEEKLGFDAALELDLEVWRRYGTIILKRAGRLLGINLDPSSPPALETVLRLLEVLCAIDGTECGRELISPDESVFTVKRCTWWENLEKAGRERVVPCEQVDNVSFEAWLEAVDPSLEMEITHSLPRGDEHCSWIIRRRQVAGGGDR